MVDLIMRTISIAIAASLALCSAAHAHTRPPYVERLRFDPNNPSRIVAGFSYGLLITEDGGLTWRFVCATAFASDPSLVDPDFDLAYDGSVSVAVIDGIFHGERDACRFDAPSGTAANTYVWDLAVDPHAANGLWAITTAIEAPELLQRSDDGGRSWAPVGAPITDVLL